MRNYIKTYKTIYSIFLIVGWNGLCRTIKKNKNKNKMTDTMSVMI